MPNCGWREAMSPVMLALTEARDDIERGNYRAAEAACRAAWHWGARNDGERP